MSSNNLQVNTLVKIELLGDQYLVEFINDTVSFYLKNQKVPFLSKYTETLTGAHHVVPIREFIIDLIKLSLRKTHLASSMDTYKQAIVEKFESYGISFEAQQISSKTIDIIAACIFARRQEL